MTAPSASSATAQLVTDAFVSFEGTRRRNFQALEKDHGQHTAWLGESLERLQNKIHWTVKERSSKEKENSDPKPRERSGKATHSGEVGDDNAESSHLDQLSSYLLTIPYLRCVDMRDKLKSMGMAAGGNKKELQKRLKSAIQAEIAAAMETTGAQNSEPTPSSAEGAAEDTGNNVAPAPTEAAPSEGMEKRDTENGDESLERQTANTASKSLLETKTTVSQTTDTGGESANPATFAPKIESGSSSKKTTLESKGLLATKTFFSPPRKKERGERQSPMEVESTAIGLPSKFALNVTIEPDGTRTNKESSTTQSSAEQRKAKLDEIRGKSTTQPPPIPLPHRGGVLVVPTPSDHVQTAAPNQKQDDATVAKKDIRSAPKSAPNKQVVKRNIQDQLPNRSVFKAPPIPSKEKEERKKILAAQMREKAAAEAQVKHVGRSAPPQVKVGIVKQVPSGQKSPDLAPDVKASEKALSPMDTYEISDRDGDSDDDDSYDDDSASDLKHIPEWARKPNLETALQRQFSDGPGRRDPDEIFPEFHTCNLKDVFGVKSKGWYDKRKSSGDWTGDRITSSEKKKYKEMMGFN